jgi:hypothetical protein
LHHIPILPLQRTLISHLHPTFRTFSTFLVDISQVMNATKSCEKVREKCAKYAKEKKEPAKKGRNAMQKWNQNSHRIAVL